jgi:flagellar biosynthesis GTPase FlhF
MADKVIAASLSLDASQAETSVKSFKTQLKEAQSSLVGITEKFGSTSKEAVEAAKKVAGFRDAIGDANSLVAAFNPDKKFIALGQAAQGITGGFAALQGAMGLIGVESENVQKQLLKVQSALAITQGLDNIRDSVQGFKNLAATIGTQVVKAFSTLRGAIISTGIGALVVGLGVLVANLDSVTEWLGLTSNATKEFNKEMDRLEAVSPQVSDKLLTLGKTAQEIADNFIKELKNEIKGLNEELGKAPSSIDEANAAIGLLKSELNGLLGDLAQATVEGTTVSGFFSQLFGISDSAKDIQKKIDANKKSQQQIDQATEDLFNLNEEKRAKREQEAFNKEQERKRDRARQAAEQEAKRIKDEKDRLAKAAEQRKLNNTGNVTDDGRNDDQEAQKKKDADEAERLNKNQAESIERRNADTENWILNNKQKTQSDAESAQERINYAQAERDAKTNFANSIGSALGALADLVGRQTAAGKILALAEIAQGTATGFINALDIAQKSAKATGPGAAFAFPIFYASQITAVLLAAAKARAVLKGGGGGGLSAPSQPGVSISAPLTPRTPQASSTILDQQALDRSGNSTFRAFVLEHDVSSQQERVTRLNRQSRLGG